MSASREKQNRQEQINSGWVDPKTIREAEQRKKEKRNSTLYAVIAVVFVLVAVVSIIWRSNIIPKSTTAVTVDGEKYTAAEVAFYYQNAYMSYQSSYYTSYLGIDSNTSLKSQTVTDSAIEMLTMLSLEAAEAGQTWHEYFQKVALKQLATVRGGLEAAEAEGFTYPDSVQAQHDETMAALESTAQANNMSVSQFLTANFGALITEEIYSEHLMDLLKFNAYSTDFSNSLTYSLEDMEAAYAADPLPYDKVSYEAISVNGAAATTTNADGTTVTPTEEERAAAKEAAKKAADKMLADFKAGEKLEDLAEELPNAVYTDYSNGRSYSGDVLTEWMFDDARKAGDTAVLESGSTYYVVAFHERFRDNTPTINVRHILIEPEAGTKAADEEGYEEEQAQLLAAAKTKAEELLAQWEAGDATEDAFAALAVEHSTDTGSSAAGGLYTQVYQGQMVDSFNDWCFDSARKSGDTDIVESSYGYHIMYFVGEDSPLWQVNITSALMADDYSAWQDSLSADSTIEQHSFGMKFVG